jgi:hypothetical protein
MKGHKPIGVSSWSHKIAAFHVVTPGWRPFVCPRLVLLYILNRLGIESYQDPDELVSVLNLMSCQSKKISCHFVAVKASDKCPLMC